MTTYMVGKLLKFNFSKIIIKLCSPAQGQRLRLGVFKVKYKLNALIFVFVVRICYICLVIGNFRTVKGNY